MPDDERKGFAVRRQLDFRRGSDGTRTERGGFGQAVAEKARQGLKPLALVGEGCTGRPQRAVTGLPREARQEACQIGAFGWSGPGLHRRRRLRRSSRRWCRRR